MKNYVKSAIASFVFASFALTGCFDVTPGATDAESSLRQTVSIEANIELPQLGCDFDARKTTAMVREKTGYIMPMTANGSVDENSIVYLIDVPAENRRFTACNMPDALKRGGMKIMFSGEEKEIYENERWSGRPFKLTQVEIQEEDPVITTSASASF